MPLRKRWAFILKYPQAMKLKQTSMNSWKTIHSYQEFNQAISSKSIAHLKLWRPVLSAKKPCKCLKCLHQIFNKSCAVKLLSLIWTTPEITLSSGMVGMITLQFHHSLILRQVWYKMEQMEPVGKMLLIMEASNSKVSAKCTPTLSCSSTIKLAVSGKYLKVQELTEVFKQLWTGFLRCPESFKTPSSLVRSTQERSML